MVIRTLRVAEIKLIVCMFTRMIIWINVFSFSGRYQGNIVLPRALHGIKLEQSSGLYEYCVDGRYYHSLSIDPQQRTGLFLICFIFLNIDSYESSVVDILISCHICHHRSVCAILVQELQMVI